MDQKAFLKHYQTLDRALFLDEHLKSLASYDGPLPIGHNQTISQPSLVAQMTLALDPKRDSRVLEIGTGSGYQTALLAPFCKTVYTIEQIDDLSATAQARLIQLGFHNIQYRIGDGCIGWMEEAPFDRIIVAAAASVVPPVLLDQLAINGRLLIPVGPPGMQDLLLISKEANGQIEQHSINKVSFVELVGDYGWRNRERE